jgi:hypothetical protein
MGKLPRYPILPLASWSPVRYRLPWQRQHLWDVRHRQRPGAAGYRLFGAAVTAHAA